MASPQSLRTPGRWDLWLPAAAVLVAMALASLGLTAARALGESRGLALDGRLLRLAHDVERDLRDGGPAVASSVLERRLREAASAVAGLALVSPLGTVEARAGELPPEEIREVDLFLGRAWMAALGFRPPGGGGHPPREAFMGGRRLLRIGIRSTALKASAVERAILPAATGAGLALVGLAVLGGRFLVRQREEQLQEATRRRLEGLGQAGAGLAHQLRNPLATIKGSCQLLLEDASPGAEKRLRAILEQAVRMERLIGHLLDYARPPQAEPSDLDLEPLMREIAGRSPRVRAAAGPAAARVDPEHFRQILDNLVDNALAVSPPDALVEITATTRDRWLEIAVADRGPGLEGDAERLFEPYVTSRADGTGLGLPIARALAEANGGSVDLRPRPGGGAVAVLRLARGEATR